MATSREPQHRPATAGWRRTLLWAVLSFTLGVGIFVLAIALLRPGMLGSTVVTAINARPTDTPSASAASMPSNEPTVANDHGAAACAVLGSTVPNVTEDNRLDTASKLTAAAATTDVEPLHSQILQIASAYTQALSVDNATVEALTGTYNYCVSIGAFPG